MRTYVLRRLLQAFPLLLGISAVTFLLLKLAPGDFVTARYSDPTVSKAMLDQLVRNFGLDKPWYVQYLLYLRNIFLHFDFGYSFAERRPVFHMVLDGLGNTLMLATAGALVTWGLAIPLGVIAAVRQHGWPDRLLSLGAFVGLSIPEVLSGLLLLYLAAQTRWFPVGSMHDRDFEDFGAFHRFMDLLWHLALPALVVGLVPLAGRMRQMRGSLLDVMRLDYVTTARAKGLDENVVIGRHALRNAMNPMITLFGFTLGSLLSGSVVVESIFAWPGLGSLTIDALIAKDQFVVLGTVLMASTLIVLGNLVADLLLAVADPRITYG